MPLALKSLEEEPTLSAEVSIHQSLGGQGTHRVLQRVPVTAQVPPAALSQTVTSPISQSIGGQGTHQITQGASISAKASPILSS